MKNKVGQVCLFVILILLLSSSPVFARAEYFYRNKNYVIPENYEVFYQTANLSLNESTNMLEGSIPYANVSPSPMFPDGVFKFDPRGVSLDDENFYYLFINGSLIGEGGGSDYYVGDTFYYEIFVANHNSTDKIKTDFTVTVIDPDGEEVENILKLYDIELDPKQFIRIHPIHYKSGEIPDLVPHKQFKFTKRGPFKLELDFNETSSGKYLRFIEYLDYYYTTIETVKYNNTIVTTKLLNRKYSEFPPPYRFYADVMPAWEKEALELTRKTTQLVEDSKDISEKIDKTLERIETLLDRMEKSQDKVTLLTGVLTFLTAVLVVLTFVLARKTL